MCDIPPTPRPPLPSQELEAEKQRKHEKAMAETCKVS